MSKLRFHSKTEKLSVKMNKKGTILHWIVFGLLAAIGLFFLLSVKATINLDKGANQLEFLEFYQEVKVVQLHFDELMQGLAVDSVLELADQGGFFENSTCGKLDDYQLWNLRDQYCYPGGQEDYYLLFNKNLEINKESLFTNNSFFLEKNYTYYNYRNILVAKRVTVTVPEVSYNEYQYFDKTFSGKTNQILEFETADKNFKYSEEASFALNFGYDLGSEYQQLGSEIYLLIETCRNRENLKECLDSEIPTYWHYTSCDAGSYEEDSRMVKFCINSPNGVSVYDYGRGIVPIEYKLALDFTPLKPFTIEDIEVYYDIDSNVYEITFESKDLHDEANIYYFILLTNDLSAEDYAGSVYNFENLYHVSTNYLEKIELSALDVVEECPSSKSAGTAYLCSEEGVNMISYVIDATYLDLADYYFTVTLEQAGEESDIAKFVSVS